MRATLPTVTELADKGAIVLLLAHFGRPKAPSAGHVAGAGHPAPIEEVLGRPVRFVDWEGDARRASRRSSRATSPSSRIPASSAARRRTTPPSSQRFARLGDLYVNDAFSAAHRAHASTEGLAHLLPAYAGRAMEAELKALEKALGEPERPVAAVVGGAKVSTKLEVLRHLVAKVDHLIIGGGMANTFLAARGVDVGKTLCEHDLDRHRRGDPRRRRAGRLHRPSAL